MDLILKDLHISLSKIGDPSKCIAKPKPVGLQVTQRGNHSMQLATQVHALREFFNRALTYQCEPEK
jgi:hypothetical protein